MNPAPESDRNVLLRTAHELRGLAGEFQQHEEQFVRLQNAAELLDRLHRQLTFLADQYHGPASVRTVDALRALQLGLDAPSIFQGRATLAEEASR